MNSDNDGQSFWSRMVAQWQPVVLVTACVAAGLTLTTMVIGSTPDVVVQASEAADAAPVDTLAAESAAATEAPADTTVPESTVIVDPASEAAAAEPGAVPAAPIQPATVVAPLPGAVPAAPSPAPTAAPTTAAAPDPAPVVTSAPIAPVTVAAPQVTSAPTTAAPAPVTSPAAPTTAAPAPTTAPPVAAALTYPSYSAGSAATVVLQFDGSSIYVASVTRQANWVSQVDKNGPRTVEIKFFNTATQRDEEFHATVENGRIKVEN